MTVSNKLFVSFEKQAKEEQWQEILWQEQIHLRQTTHEILRQSEAMV
jgi:hypothetical protein